MSKVRLYGSTSGYSEIIPPAVAGDQTFTLPGTGGTLDRLNRAGNVLQVVNATYGTQVTNSTNVYADTGLAATITPTSASSKILVLVNQVGCYKDTSDTQLWLRLLRGASQILIFENYAGQNGTVNAFGAGSCSACYLDSPATTSATTYKTQLASGANTARVGVQIASAGHTSTITLMEIAA